nr:intestinal mucin [Corynebacterium lactis]
MNKFSSAFVAVVFSTGMLVGSSVATAQIPAPAPETCPLGQDFGAVDGKVVCVGTPAAPSESRLPGIPPKVEDTDRCPDGSIRDMGKKDPVTGVWGGCPGVPTSAVKPDEPAAPSESRLPGIPPKVEDTDRCPDGSIRDMGKKDPVTGVWGGCPGVPSLNDSTKDPVKPTEPADKSAAPKKGEEKSKDDSKKSDEKKTDAPKKDEKQSKDDSKKSDEKKAPASSSSGLAVTGVQATAFGGAALALIVGGVAATRYARKNSKDS